jgi:hypothetical protein
MSKCQTWRIRKLIPVPNLQPKWQEYQDEVAKFLRDLGFSVKIEERCQGARGEHDIDVTARITVASIPQLWIVECKKWRRAVPKERVLTFVGIVSDVGADRGLLFSESGFQAGAIRIATSTNVTLTSLRDFRENAADELLGLKVRALDERVARLNQKFMAIWDLDETERNAALDRYSHLGLPDTWGRPDISTITARLSQLRHSLEDARFGRWPAPYFPLDHSDTEVIDVTDWDGLLFVTKETLATCELIHEYMFDTERIVADWKELQTPELTELLETIRKR